MTDPTRQDLELVTEFGPVTTDHRPPPPPPPPPRQSPPPDPGMTALDIPCPRCGQLVAVSGKRPRADEFCPDCDYPVFWARPPWQDPSESSEGRLRLPGTGGAADEFGVLCPHCAEPNHLGAEFCIRCGQSMVLPPPTVFVEPEPVIEVVEPVIPPAPVRSIVPFLATLVVAVVLLGFLLTVIG